MSRRRTIAKLRHRDVIEVALRRLEEQLHSPQRESVIEDTLREVEGSAVEHP